MRQTPLAQLIEVKLGVDLQRYVTEARDEGADWRSIARDLTERSGTSVSHEAVRSWFIEDATASP
jgi:hypothetical protein